MSERTYHCPICLDHGVVVVFNPRFVAEYGPTWDLDRADGRNHVDLYDRIKRFWRLRPEFPELGPLNHSAICDCDCRRSRILAAELAKFFRGERINREKRNVAPAAGWVRDRKLAPLWPGPVDCEIAKSLEEFYSRRLF